MDNIDSTMKVSYPNHIVDSKARLTIKTNHNSTVSPHYQLNRLEVCGERFGLN